MQYIVNYMMFDSFTEAKSFCDSLLPMFAQVHAVGRKGNRCFVSWNRMP